MNTPDERDDQRLHALLHDAVADVEPRDGLAEVRRRTRRRTSSARRLTPVLVGAGAVAATVVVATLAVGTLGDDGPEDLPVSSPGPSDRTSSDDPVTSAAGIYFVSETPSGPRLFREFQAVTPTTDPAERVLVALRRLTADVGPIDPDYRTLWPAGAFGDVRVEDDRVVVELADDDALMPTEVEGQARYGVQQAVYTAEAALGEALPVAFEVDGRAARWVLGMRVGVLVGRDRSSDLTAPVNVTDPSENLAVESTSFSANGTMAASVRRIDWAVLGGADGRVVREGRASPIDITGPDARATLGAPGWETGPIDVGDLEPGRYLFVARVTDVGQTSDSPVIYEDTRAITVR